MHFTLLLLIPMSNISLSFLTSEEVGRQGEGILLNQLPPSPRRYTTLQGDPDFWPKRVLIRGE